MHKIFLTILIIGFTILNANATTSVIYNSAGQPIEMRNFSANPFPNIYRRQILPPNPPNLIMVIHHHNQDIDIQGCIHIIQHIILVLVCAHTVRMIITQEDIKEIQL